jgi:hypothetical protein
MFKYINDAEISITIVAKKKKDSEWETVTPVTKAMVKKALCKEGVNLKGRKLHLIKNLGTDNADEVKNFGRLGIHGAVVESDGVGEMYKVWVVQKRTEG